MEKNKQMKDIIENRLKKLTKSFFKEKIDTLMVVVEENRRYLSGFTGHDTNFNESAGALFITDSKLILATDSRFKLQAEKESPLYEIVCYKQGLFKELPDIIEKLQTKRLGFESERVSYYNYHKIIEQLESKNLSVELKPVREIIENLRKIKSEQEIQATKNALNIAEQVFRKVVKTIRPGMREKAIAWEMEKGMREAGADDLSFPVICASGPNSAMPHAIAGDRKIQECEPVLFDWGARLNGYCSDTSRTIVTGKPDSTFKKIYNIVLNAQIMAIKAIKSGVSSKEIDNIARSYIADNGYKENFGHGLGHGTGLAIHEAPSLTPFKDIILETGMLVTVEPGIYIPGWGGIRIENQIIVRDHGSEVLNRLDTSMFVI